MISGIASHVLAPISNPTMFDPVKDFTHIAMLGTFPNVLIAHPSVSTRTVGSFIEAARAAPGKISRATARTQRTAYDPAPWDRTVTARRLRE